MMKKLFDKDVIAQDICNMPDKELADLLQKPSLGRSLDDVIFRGYLNSVALSRILMRLNTPTPDPP